MSGHEVLDQHKDGHKDMFSNAYNVGTFGKDFMHINDMSMDVSSVATSYLIYLWPPEQKQYAAGLDSIASQYGHYQHLLWWPTLGSWPFRISLWWCRQGGMVWWSRYQYQANVYQARCQKAPCREWRYKYDLEIRATHASQAHFRHNLWWIWLMHV